MNSTTLSKRRMRLAGVSVVLGLLLAACGGGGGGGGESTDGGGSSSASFISDGSIAARAGESSTNFVAAVREVVALGQDETRESLSLQGVNDPPEDNTSEPVTL